MQRGYVSASLDANDRRWQEDAFEMIHTIEWRYRQRYNLPPTDPRFLHATYEQMVTDEWAHYLAELEQVGRKRGLLPHLLTLDVLLKAAKERDLEQIEQTMDLAAAEADLAAREAEQQQSEPFIRMSFDGTRHQD